MELAYDFGREAPLWDEFSPNLIGVRVALAAAGASDRTELRIGLREIRTQGRSFLVNGRPTMMRGTLDCAAFPLTGYPSMEVGEWRRVFRVAKRYGLNHIRFHSWCPPKAAFVAGDIEGMYLQPEAPVWRGTCPFPEAEPVYPYLVRESERICTAYGNHPSFVMFVHGNEPWELDQDWLNDEWVPAMKKLDPRHLVCAGAHYPVADNNDFHLPGASDGFKLRYHGEFEAPPSTRRHYEDQIRTRTAPCIAHETGQWCVFPNLKEIDKYTGCLQPNNFRIVRDFLEQNHLLDQAEDFLRASGKFQTLIYKESNEAFLRTRGMGGYQLLGLNDFPGQGTALIGVVDVFWEDKGYVAPEAFRAFNGPLVPLALMEKFVWTSDEVFSAEIRIAQYSQGPLKNVTPVWRLLDERGGVVAQGEFAAGDIPLGNDTVLGEVEVALDGIAAATRLTLHVALPGAECHNAWNIWVYPPAAQPTPGALAESGEISGGAVFCTARQEAIEALEAGRSVVFAPGPEAFASETQGTFAPIFWNKAWFPAQKEHTLGLLCDPEHPALAGFPTAFHADFQWHDPMTRSRPIVMDGLDPALRPIVQPIDDWNTCRRLGLIFEARVGWGKLLVTSIDLSGDLASRPVARKLRQSLTRYAASADFAPRHRLSDAQFDALVPKRPLRDVQATVTASSAAPGHDAANLLDASPATIWQTPREGDAPNYPHYLVLDLKTPVELRGLRFLPRQDGSASGRVKDVAVRVGANGIDWQQLVTGTLTNNPEWKQLDFKTRTRWIRIELLSPHNAEQAHASLAELDIVAP